MRKAIDDLAENPRPQSSEAVKGPVHAFHRLVVERDYRVVYLIEDDVLRVLVVVAGDRKEVYRLMDRRDLPGIAKARRNDRKRRR